MAFSFYMYGQVRRRDKWLLLDMQEGYVACIWLIVHLVFKKAFTQQKKNGISITLVVTVV